MNTTLRLLSAAAALLGAVLSHPADAASVPPASREVVIVANKAENTVSIIDTASTETLAKLSTGKGPHEVAVSPDGALAVAMNYGDGPEPGDSLTVIDLHSMKVARTIDLGEFKRPHGAVFLRDGRQVLVTAEASMALVVVDVVEGRVRGHIPVNANIHMVVASPDGRRAYAGGVPQGVVVAVDLAQGKVLKSIPVGGFAEGIGITADGKQVWAASKEQNAVSVIDTETLKVTGRRNASGFPIRIVGSPDGRRMLVTNVEGSLLQIFDTATGALSGTVRFAQGSGPVGTAVSADGTRAYVSMIGKNAVAVIDLEKAEIVGTLATGVAPDGLACARLAPATE